MLLHRVFPSLPGARPGAPGHGLHVHPDQGYGRWDNPDLYIALYLASSPSGAIGETFAQLTEWGPAMLEVPFLPGATRALGVYRLDEEAAPLLDLDDPKALVERAVRPSEVVARNRPHTQGIARSIHAEGRWAGLSWWSMHRPRWALHCLFGVERVELVEVVDLGGHPALADAARLLGKRLDPDLG